MCGVLLGHGCCWLSRSFLRKTDWPLPARRLQREQRDGLREDSIGTNRSETCSMSFQECLTRTVLLLSPCPAHLFRAAPAARRVPGSSSCLSRGCGGAQWVPTELMCTTDCSKSPGSSGAAEELGSSRSTSPAQAAWPNTPSGAQGAFPALRLTGIPLMQRVIPSADFSTDSSLSTPPQPASLKHPQPAMLLHLRSPSFNPLLVPNQYSAFSKSRHSNLSPAHTICK